MVLRNIRESKLSLVQERTSAVFCGASAESFQDLSLFVLKAAKVKKTKIGYYFTI